MTKKRTSSVVALTTKSFAFLLLVAGMAALSSEAFGQVTPTVFVNFQSPGAGYPGGNNTLVRANDGAFYGMSVFGGANGYGAVFKVTQAGELTTLVNFDYSSGALPDGGLLLASDGHFYGFTRYGGNFGNGTAFKMTPAGELTTLAGFQNSTGTPAGSPVEGNDGNFYAMAGSGGSSGYGTVFRMTPAGALTTLANFNYSNGAYPSGSLVRDVDGNFYGLTQTGGNNGNGTAFKITPSGTLTTLVHFTNNMIGYSPRGTLVLGSDGNFYGTAQQGGNLSRGTVFKMTPSGVVTVLTHFSAADGSNPGPNLIQASDGNLYGMTTGGGTSSQGTIFRLTTAGTLTTLFSFSPSSIQAPQAGFAQGSNGALFGMNTYGGSDSRGFIFSMDVGAPSLVPEIEVRDAGNGLITDGSARAFGVLGVGASADLVFTIRNASIDSLTGVVASIDGPDAADFSLVSTPDGTIAPLGSSTVTVRFTPSSSGPKSAFLRIGSNDADENPYDIGLVGGPEAEIAVEQPVGTNLPDGGTRAFPGLVVGNTADLAFTVSNSGAAPLTGLGITIDGPHAAEFSVVSAPSAPVAVSGTTTFTVRFAPVSEGAKSAVLHLASNDVDEAPYDIVLSGAGWGLNSIQRLVALGTPGPSQPGYGSLLRAADGNFYGMTQYGGSSNAGTVFKVTPAGVVTTLVSFDGSNGSAPYGSLIQGSDGDFYGMTSSGGSGGSGTVFKMNAAGTLTTLVAFDYSNGAQPYGSLVQGSDGNFYGMTRGGGSNYSGTIFKVTPAGDLTTLVALNSSTGNSPYGSLIQGSDGDFYGMTNQGGSGGYGSIFKVTSTGQFTMLANLNYNNGNPYGSLIQGSDGDFYGLTRSGGTNGYGTAFRMTSDGVVTTLASFTNSMGSPYGSLVQASNGHFYGVTTGGTLFRITSAGTFTVLDTFVSNTDGSNPQGTLVQGLDGLLYGMTSSGGPNYSGTIFFVPIGEGQLPAEIGVETNGAPVADGGTRAFGTVAAGSSSNLVFTIRNLGGQDLTGVSASIDGLDAAEFALTSTPAATVASPGGSTALTVTFSPTGTGPKAAVLHISSNDADESPYDITLIGGPEPEIGVEQPAGTPLADGRTTKTFPATLVGSTSDLTFTVSNTGAAPLTGLGITIDGQNASDFSVTTAPTAPVGVSGSTTFTVRFAPGNGGLKKATLHLANNDVDESPFDIKLQATGIALGDVYAFASFGTGSAPNAPYYNSLTLGHDGNLYGLTSSGGAGGYGYGTAFRVSLDGTITTLVDFNNSNGAYPQGGLLLASDGDFYGMTSQGGNNDTGTLFKMTPAGVLTTLIHFDGTNGSYPYGSLIQGRDGDLYGMTSSGGTNGSGTIFKITLAGSLTTLVHFQSSSTGASPSGNLIEGTDGNFYGMTQYGGVSSSGTIFKMTPAGRLTTLVSFNGTNGSNPYGSLVQGSDGSFYGVTPGGGPSYAGVIFKLSPSGVLTTLVQCNNTTGTNPYRGLTLASDGNFYGLTGGGGAQGSGTVFRLTQAGVFTVLDSFNDSPEGAYPFGSLVQGYDGVLYGMTRNGGQNGMGTIFSVHIGTGPLPADIAVEQPSPMQVPDGGARVFGVVPVGSSADLAFTIRNTGAQDLTGIAASIDGPDAGEFSLVTTPAATLPGPAGSSSFTVRFTPSSTSPKQAVLHIASNDADEAPYDIRLVGGPEPEIGIEAPSATAIEDGDIYALGSAVVGSRNDLTFTIRNTGTAALTGLAVTVDGADAASFSILSAPASSVAPADSTTFVLRFLPTTGGTKSAALHVANNDTDEAPYDIPLSAAGVGVGDIDVISHLASPGPSQPGSGRLIVGSDGNFYGLTTSGGDSGYGTAFKVTPGGVTTTLASFNYSNGNQPQGSLVLANDGNFYGMSRWGGNYGNGVVFKLTPAGVLTKLVDFDFSSGRYPNGNLIQGPDGSLYGMTNSGGSSYSGTIFKVTLEGVLTVLVNFNGSNGGYPNGSLILGSDGNFYGVTSSGGAYGQGIVFKMTPSGTLTTLAEFDGSNGQYPPGSLVEGPDGSFYGMTSSGGSSNFGTVFKVTPAGVITTMVNFTGSNGKWGTDGLVLASDGNFYGLTVEGGTDNLGTIFRLTPAGVHSVLDSFDGGTTGSGPRGALVEGPDGNLYGMTGQGGSSGAGTIFRVFTRLPVTTQPQTITFTNPGIRIHGDAPFALGATASSGLTVSYTVVSGPATVSGGTITLTGAGSVTIRASQAGDTNFDPAPDVEQTFTVLPSNNANLASFTLGAGTLAPSFSSNVTAYGVTVPNTTTSISFTAAAADANATLGGSSSPLSLNVGTNTLTVLVTAANGTTTKTYTVTVTRQTVQQTNYDTGISNWAATNGLPPAESDPGDDPDGDGHTNLEEFAFGTHPGTGSSGSAAASFTGGFASANLTAPGQPAAHFEPSSNGVDNRAVFTRRADHATLGITYTVRFSADMITWQTTTVTPTVLDTEGGIQLVSVGYPLFVKGRRARFFQVIVNQP
ncbi:MAG: choice-of-anchor tandem repeat GloVer-containing protein [Prosthecobacter sp.]